MRSREGLSKHATPGSRAIDLMPQVLIFALDLLTRKTKVVPFSPWPPSPDYYDPNNQQGSPYPCTRTLPNGPSLPYDTIQLPRWRSSHGTVLIPTTKPILSYFSSSFVAWQAAITIRTDSFTQDPLSTPSFSSMLVILQQRTPGGRVHREFGRSSATEEAS